MLYDFKDFELIVVVINAHAEIQTHISALMYINKKKNTLFIKKKSIIL